MRRMLALGFLAALALALSALVLWPQEHRRQGAACANEPSPTGAATPVVNPSRNVPAPAKHDETHSATWREFIAACRRKDFATARKLAPAVTAAAVDGCADLLALPR